MSKFFITIIFVVFSQFIIAQDTLLLLTGRKIIVSSVDLQGNTIAYRQVNKPGRLKKIDPDRVFSVIYKDGNERIVYLTDSLDPLDFKVDEMRNFIKGVQDAKALYRNNYIKAGGLGVGVASGYFAIYGLIGPPIYSTILGAFSPNIEKILSFKISGSAADDLGISHGKFINEIEGKNRSPVIKKDHKLSFGHSTIHFTEDTQLEQAVTMINSKFDCSLVHATESDGKIKLFKAEKSLLSQPPYREGFEKRVRDYKIRSAMISGLVGIVVGIIAFTIILNDEE